MALRILVADDSPFWREQLRTILEGEPDWLVFQATNGLEALQKATSIQPDAILLDACMPVLDGLSAAREFRRMLPQVPVVMVTADTNAFLELKAREAAVLAVFSKRECLDLRLFLKRMFLAKAA